jgi:predicted RNA-binding Zn ribbon-like protein
MIFPALPSPLVIAGHLAIDFVNSRAMPNGVPVDWLHDGQALVGWMSSLSLFPAADLQDLQQNAPARRLDDVAAEARELRELLRGQLARPKQLRTDTGIWKAVNEVMARGSSFQLLRRNDAEPQLEDHERLQKPGQLLVPIAKAIGRLIVEEDLTRLHACEGPGCILWFLDSTKAGHRRFCSTSGCGNRAKVAAFRSRQREQPR